MLVPLAEPYLDQRDQARLADQDAFNAGLAWATRDINPNVSLLQPAATDSYSRLRLRAGSHLGARYADTR